MDVVYAHIHGGTHICIQIPSHRRLVAYSCSMEVIAHGWGNAWSDAVLLAVLAGLRYCQLCVLHLTSHAGACSEVVRRHPCASWATLQPSPWQL